MIISSEHRDLIEAYESTTKLEGVAVKAWVADPASAELRAAFVDAHNAKMGALEAIKAVCLDQ